jgi:Nuclease-related domain
MASSPHPDNERERFPVPWEDDDTLGLSIHALTRQDMEAILASMPDEPHDEPPLRLPSLQRAAAAQRRQRRAYGTPGASAQAQYQRRRAAEHAAWAHTLPLRVAATALAGLGGLLLATIARLPAPASLLAAITMAAAAWWRLRFRPSAEALAWQRGAEGERHVARLLEPLVRAGWGVNHDLRVPGSRANVDHVVVGPPGIFAIDTKHYRGRLRLSPDGLLWHGRTFLARPCAPPAGRPISCKPASAPPTSRWCRSWPCWARRCPTGRSPPWASRSSRRSGWWACYAACRRP